MANPASSRPDLQQLADEVISELVASGEVEHYSGELPTAARRKLKQSDLRFDDEAVLEDIFADRMLALTKNSYVEEAGDEDLVAKVLTPSHDRPVMVDIYSEYCRPCNHILPVVYSLASKYRNELKVVKLNISKNARFREAFLGAVQFTPAFMFFRNGKPIRATSGVGRLFGQTAFIASTRTALEKRIRSIVNAV
jgi:thiol-disulfide isomerase/thioredoxin